MNARSRVQVQPASPEEPPPAWWNAHAGPAEAYACQGRHWEGARRLPIQTASLVAIRHPTTAATPDNQPPVFAGRTTHTCRSLPLRQLVVERARDGDGRPKRCYRGCGRPFKVTSKWLPDT